MPFKIFSDHIDNKTDLEDEVNTFILDLSATVVSQSISTSYAENYGTLLVLSLEYTTAP
jgi:hypothetical protein